MTIDRQITSKHGKQSGTRTHKTNTNDVLNSKYCLVDEEINAEKAKQHNLLNTRTGAAILLQCVQ